MFLIVFNELHVVRLFYIGFLFLHFFRKLIFFREWENVLCHQLYSRGFLGPKQRTRTKSEFGPRFIFRFIKVGRPGCC